MSLVSLVCTVLIACSGGGGNAGGDGGVAPVLSGISVEPDSAAAGLTISVAGDFTFADPDGDLDGGSFNYTYEGTTYAFALPPELAGLTGGNVAFQLDVILSATPGTLNVPCWLVDDAGHRSNTVFITFTQFWTRQFGTLLEDVGQSVAIDADDNVLVAGTTQGNLDGETNLGGSDVFVTKYASDTSRTWTRLIGSENNDSGRGVAVDRNNNVYITGDSTGTMFDGNVTDGVLDGFLSKYDAAGNRVWTRLVGSNGTPDQCYAVATDASNSIYVAGQTTGDLHGQTNAGNWDAFLVKYDSNGNRLWTRLLGTSAGDFAYAVATDAAGNVYVSGGTEGVLGIDPSPGDPIVNYDAFIARYDTFGTLQWITQVGTACSEWGNTVAIGGANHLYIGGRIFQCAFMGNTASGGYDAFLVHLDSAGDTQWVRQFGMAEHDSTNGIGTDGAGNAYVTGFLDSVSFNDDNEGGSIFLAQYDSSGIRGWLAQENAGYSWGNQGLSVAADSLGNVFLTGTVHGQIDGHVNANAGEDDVFILKYDASGIRR